MNYKEALKKEFLTGRTTFDWGFIVFGLVLQIVVYCVQPSSVLSFISSLAGILSVTLCAQGKISTFIFGFIQVYTYAVLAYEQHLWAEVAQNAYYFCTMIYGIFVWKSRYSTDTDSARLLARHLKPMVWVMSVIVIIALSFFVGFLLDHYTDDTQPYLDAFTTIPAIFAQVLMILGYREQWIIWLLIDIGLTTIWLRAGDYCLTAQHLFWCANCVYGYVNWKS